MRAIVWYLSLSGAFLFGWVACCAFEGMSAGYREARRLRDRQGRLEAILRAKGGL